MATQTGATSRTQPTAADGGTNRIQEAASGLIDQAGSTAEVQASRTMTQAGDTLHQIAQAIRDAGKGMRSEQPQVAGFADTAADQVDRSAQYLRNHDATQVLNAATDFARRQPAVVVGGGLLLGLAVGRFLRTASETTGSQFAPGVSSGYGRYGDTRYTDPAYRRADYATGYLGEGDPTGSRGTEPLAGRTTTPRGGSGRAKSNSSTESTSQTKRRPASSNASGS